MMITRLYKLVLSLFLCSYSYAGITLKACDEYGKSTNTFNVGMPWTLEVSLEDMSDVKSRPTIKGLDQMYARDSSMMTTSINGKVTIKYSYRVRFDAVGTYTIGPASIERNGQVYNSNSIVVTIVDQPADSGQAHAKDNSSALFVRMKVDKDRVVVGEKFKCILRCYYTDQVSNASPSSTMQLDGFVFEDGSQQGNGIETIKGVNYNYFELCWNVHATKPGKKNIPAYSIDYVANTNPYGSHASAIAMMLGHTFGERKRSYSNVVPIIVDALPPHNGAVHAIGSFSYFTAKIDPVIAKQGEGMVLTLELMGQGNFNKEYAIELQHMPSEFKYYDSKQYDDAAHGPKKYFEFIVQGLSAGQWTLPNQQFTFFDTKTRTYKTLETDTLSVKIIPNSVSKQNLAKFDGGQQSTLNQIDVIDEIKPLMMHEGTAASAWPAFPLWLIIVLVILPLAALGYEEVKNRTGIFQAIHFRASKKNAFIHARNQIKKVFEQQQVSRIYSIFVDLFATRCSVDQQMVNQEFIYDVLKKSGMHLQELEQWNQFYNQLNELMFSNKQINHNEYQVLRHYTDRWIDRLESII